MKIDRNFDVPYLAGYSKDGDTIYIDRDMPRKLRVNGVPIFVADLLLEAHEHVEQALEAQGLTYKEAHKFATKYEHFVCKKMGVDPMAYEEALRPYEKFALVKRNPQLPPDLDPQPYVGDEKYKSWFG